MSRLRIQVVDDAGTATAELAATAAIRKLDPHVSHVMHNSGDNEWYSPAPYVEAARSVMRNIDLDPASSPAANKVVKAAKFYTADDNGLEHEWKGRVFMNPPYSTELIVPFIEKLVASVKDGAVPEAVVLVNNATETQWFARLSSVATCLCLPMGRLQFQHPTRPSAKPLQGQIVAYVGQHGARFVATFREFGTCWSATR